MSLKNSRAKGWRNVRKCRIQLENEGWITDTCEKTGRFLKNKDLFGLWDFIAIHPKFGVKFIQVKTNKKDGKWTVPYKEFGKRYSFYTISEDISIKKIIMFEIWIVHDRQKKIDVILCDGV